MKPPNLIYDLLIECCKVTFDEKKLNILLSSFENWDNLFYSANKHGILPLVYKKLKNEKLSIPEEVLQNLKNLYILIAKQNMTISADLTKTIKLFKENNINAIALKGPTLSQLNYNDITLRQYGDLDILVDKSSLYDAAKLLMNKNYKMNYPIEYTKNTKHLLLRKDLQLKNYDKNLLIELHWKFLDNIVLDINHDFFNLTQAISINNEVINTFKNENLLLYLCIHGSKHFWERLEWIVDVDRLIRNNKIDWRSVQEQANSSQVNRMFYMGLLIIRSLFNTPLPESIQNEITKYKVIHIVNKDILEYLYDDIIHTKENAHLPQSAINKINMLLNDNYNDKTMKFKMAYNFRINQTDLFKINLPNYLSSLYYIFPLVRLIKKAFKRLQ